MNKCTAIFYLCSVGLVFISNSCKTNPGEWGFQNSSQRLLTADTLESENTLSAYKFQSSDTKPRELGKYTDRVRVGNWFYFDEGHSVLVSWARYKNEELKYKTNLFSNADTIMHGLDYTRFGFTTEQGVILATIMLSRDSIVESPREYFQKLNEIVAEEGGRILSKELMLLNDGTHTIYVEKKKCLDSADSLNLLQNLMALTGDGMQVRVAVLSRISSTRDASILFDGILTNFFIGDKRLYNPFKGLVSAVPSASF